jgi:hypothetical protein
LAFDENARFGSHADRAVCGKRGLVTLAKNPRLAATAVANALTVATHAFFIDRGLGASDCHLSRFYQIKETALVKQENERQREIEVRYTALSLLARRPGK